MEGGVECFKDLREESAGSFAEVPENLLRDLFKSGKELVNEHLQFLSLLVFVVLTNFGHLSAEVYSSLYTIREIVH